MTPSYVIHGCTLTEDGTVVRVPDYVATFWTVYKVIALPQRSGTYYEEHAVLDFSTREQAEAYVVAHTGRS